MEFRAGDHVEGRVRLLPHGGPALPGGYDFAYHGYYDGIGANGFVLGSLRRTAVQPPRDAMARARDTIHNLRQTVAARIVQVAGTGDPGTIAAALVSGMTDPISEEGANVLRRTGLAHILSISGLHMALVAGIFLAGLRALAALFPGFSSRHPVKKYAAAGALAGAFAYLHLAGGSVATQRSFVMLAVMLLALLFDRSALTMRNLAVAAMVVLVISPHEIAGPSFQMSFAATAALIAVYGALAHWREARTRRAWRGGLLRRGMRLLVIGIGALALTALIGGSATALYAAYHFHAVAPLGLVTNVLAMPLVSFVVMPAGVAGTLAMPFGLDAPFFAAMGWGTARVLDIARWVDTLSGPGITGIVPGRGGGGLLRRALPAVPRRYAAARPCRRAAGARRGSAGRARCPRRAGLGGREDRGGARTGRSAGQPSARQRLHARHLERVRWAAST
ncbi:MAG: ComEC/Rec2 family competence protein [Brucellaceae bacterium]|nr:ComEC/Rec2 family competence protein [Brucellaceae bacterium]